MNVYLIQRPIVWEDTQANFEEIDRALEAVPPSPGSLVVSAEMFSTGFSFELSKIGEEQDGASSQFLRYLAMKYSVCTVGSFPHQPPKSEKGRNRLVAYYPDGTLAIHYDKIHPFSYGKESEFYEGGDRLPLFSYQGWTICPSICYDLRFPELYRRATLKGGAELFICVANWPQTRREHWNCLLQARAIENQSIMVAVNRIGRDPLNCYAGDSAVIDSRGQTLIAMGETNGVSQVTIDRSSFLEWREKFPALLDATETFQLIS